MSEPRFRFVTDNDCHDYLIPADRYGEWDAWRNIPSDDEASWEPPGFAIAIDGYSTFTFTDPRPA